METLAVLVVVTDGTRAAGVAQAVPATLDIMVGLQTRIWDEELQGLEFLLIWVEELVELTAPD
jgi:hypothetical protein